MRQRRGFEGSRVRRNAAKERFWRRHIARQARSGISVRAYCEQHGVSEPSFYAWRRELARREGEAAGARPRANDARRRPGRRFVALTLKRAAAVDARLPAPAGALELVHPRGHVLRIGPGCDRATLAAVLAALEQSSC
jgi:transposase-like protein